MRNDELCAYGVFTVNANWAFFHAIKMRLSLPLLLLLFLIVYFIKCEEIVHKPLYLPTGLNRKMTREKLYMHVQKQFERYSKHGKMDPKTNTYMEIEVGCLKHLIKTGRLVHGKLLRASNKGFDKSGLDLSQD